ncbi:methyl-accepting chemotaxis protein [Azospirillaceae bacterium]
MSPRLRDLVLERKKMESVQRLERETRIERQKHLESLIQEFEHGVSNVITSVADAARQLENTAQVLSSNADKTNHQSTIVASAAGQASSNAQTAAAETETLTDSVNEISRHALESSKIAEQAVTEADHANVTIVGLVDTAQKIGQVVQLINNIASQTNLLALKRHDRSGASRRRRERFCRRRA